MKTEKNNCLAALSAAALTLPGISSSVQAQDSIVSQPEISYRYSSYNEEAIESEKTIEGLVDPDAKDAARYEIDVHQLRFKSPLWSSAEITVDVLSEAMSGASPRYVLPAASNGEVRPIQVMSGATIEEERNDVDVSFAFVGEKVSVSNGFGFSKENDYESLSLNLGVTFILNDKNTILELGLSASKDSINATQDPNRLPGAPTRIVDEKKISGSYTLGISQILSRSSIFSSSLNVASYSGYLSDPYKSVYLVDNGFGFSEVGIDNRPDKREQLAWSNQYRQHFSKVNGSLHLDYRYFFSDWETKSHTLDLRWAQEFGTGWTVIPSIRHYDQTAAAFFQNWYELPRADSFQSSDYRLSDYQALSLKLKIIKKFTNTALHFSYENYTSEAGEENPILSSPALVDFSHVSIGFDFRF